MSALASKNGYSVRTRTSELLRIATAGSVDDGKSTLIGGLLSGCKLLAKDQVAALGRLIWVSLPLWLIMAPIRP